MASDERRPSRKVPGACTRCHVDRTTSLNCSDEDFILVKASERRHVDCVKACLAAGADVNRRDRWGEPTLICAVRAGDVQCVELLLKAGADVNIQDKDGKTALFDAVWQCSVQCTDVLLKAGADVNIQTQWGRTALFYAVRYDSVQCTNLLLKSGADMNIRDINGETALFLSSFHRRDNTSDMLNTIRVMLLEGIKVNVRNNHGFNALTFHLDYTTHYSTSHSLHSSKFAMLLMSAGETVDKDERMKLLHLLNENNGIVQAEVLDYLKSPANISLMNICRESIRKHMLQMSDVNLFVRVPRLPLPRLLMSYLLYDVTLDFEEENKQ